MEIGFLMRHIPDIYLVLYEIVCPFSPSLIKEGEVRWRTGGGLKVNILSKLLMKLKYFNIVFLYLLIRIFHNKSYKASFS